MANYTTGELAQICGVSIRTVQYYDHANLLKPDHLTDSGRRIYSEEQVQQLRIILGYKQLGFSLKDIQKIMKSTQRESVLGLLLQQQLAQVKTEQQQLATQEQALAFLLATLQVTGLPVEKTIIDIETAMTNQKQLQKLHRKMIYWGILVDGLEITLLLLGLLRGIWWPSLLGIPIVIGLAIYISRLYYQETAYICPVCQTRFRPSFGQQFWAKHTPKTRQLKCPYCGEKHYCVEVSRILEEDV
ncbi:MerR family transcriptional regulator [Latilactobacillus sakei]|uniref:MerR family transcriptional regulator n=1 Tax=Latilactobacillus sakei TaxID=1599 RepID=A0AAF0K3Z3_LATSK|nr:MerR family transcriptional regulator [Latilactobacillus sakei]WGI19009.1 MerR family transcriptional regulator [Latilactobacillus sakei]